MERNLNVSKVETFKSSEDLICMHARVYWCHFYNEWLVLYYVRLS
jgi:hypothetical protein